MKSVRTRSSRQLNLLKPESKSYGGVLLKTRRGRRHGRPLATKFTMHLVLRSSRAKGAWSFRQSVNRKRVEGVLAKFARKFGVRILSFANVGNHMHLQIHLTHRSAYKPFIRAVTGAIAMAITGVNRWTKGRVNAGNPNSAQSLQGARHALGFWDYRPFTRIVVGHRAILSLIDYIRINEWEGFGVNRRAAEFVIKGGRLSSA